MTEVQAKIMVQSMWRSIFMTVEEDWHEVNSGDSPTTQINQTTSNSVNLRSPLIFDDFMYLACWTFYAKPFVCDPSHKFQTKLWKQKQTEKRIIRAPFWLVYYVQWIFVASQI